MRRSFTGDVYLCFTLTILKRLHSMMKNSIWSYEFQLWGNDKKTNTKKIQTFENNYWLLENLQMLLSLDVSNHTQHRISIKDIAFIQDSTTVSKYTHPNQLIKYSGALVS